MSKGELYLEKNLLPLINSMKTIPTNSFILKAAGLETLNSQSSTLIQVGNRLETFWNIVINDCATNLLTDSNRIIVEGKSRQIDHLFIGKNKNKIFYLESKCNVEFDTEKKPASNEKIKQISNSVTKMYNKEVLSGYFIPIVDEIPLSTKKKYSDTNLYGVNWMLDTINCDKFTSEEFFTFFKQIVGNIIKSKLGITKER